MMKEYKAEHKCENCKRNFTWVALDVPRSKITSGGLPTVVEIPEEPKAKAYDIVKGTDGTTIARVNCPHCDFDNTIIVSD